MRIDNNVKFTKVNLDDDNNYESENKDYLKINTLEKIQNNSFLNELFRVLKAIIFGLGIEKSEGDVGLLRKFANRPRTFKIIAR